MHFYRDNVYLLFTVLALLLFVNGLLNFNNIKYGVDFRGGYLITFFSDSVDREFLLNEFSEGRVVIDKVGNRYKVEIELPIPEDIFLMEEDLYKLRELVKEMSLSLSEGKDVDVYVSKIKEIFERNNISFVLRDNPDFYLNKFNEELENRKKAYLSSIISKLKSKGYESASAKAITPTLSKSFLESALGVFVQSALLVIAFTFFIFRKVIPSLAVLIGALFDLVIVIGFMALFGIPLTLVSFAAILMLLGYSLDTDILLTSRVVKRDGSLEDALSGAMGTGLTMSVTAFISFSALFLVAYLLKIGVYYEIASVILLGLIGDVVATWGINGALLYNFYKR